VFAAIASVGIQGILCSDRESGSWRVRIGAGRSSAQRHALTPAAHRSTQASQLITGKGVVKKVDPAKKTANLNHEPIPAIGWPAMSMDFAVAPAVDLSKVQPGRQVDFGLEKGSGSNYTVTSITPAAK